MVFKPHFYPPVTLPLVNIHYKELWCIRQLVRIILLLSFYWIHVIFLYISHPSLYLTFPQGILLYFKHTSQYNNTPQNLRVSSYFKSFSMCVTLCICRIVAHMSFLVTIQYSLLSFMPIQISLAIIIIFYVAYLICFT